MLKSLFDKKYWKENWLIIVVVLAVSTLSVMASIFLFSSSFLRLFEAFKDFGLSFKFYFYNLFDKPIDFEPSVIHKSEVLSFAPAESWSNNWNELRDNFVSYFQVFATKEAFYGYLVILITIFRYLSIFLLPVICLGACIYVVFSSFLSTPRFSHIIDYDMIRLGKTMSNNKDKGAFEFGVVCCSEFGKERRNTKFTNEHKISGADNSVNYINDGFNDGLKMLRHNSTVDNVCFLKIISDEQRAPSIGADILDLFTVISIEERYEKRCAFPFTTLLSFTVELLYRFFERLYFNVYRFYRSDNNLFIHCLHNIMARFWKFLDYLLNKFGYCKLKLAVESGTLKDKPINKKYYFMDKKIYSDRFRTTGLEHVWEDKNGHATVGIQAWDTYENLSATWDELKKQNSLFIKNIEKYIFDNSKDIKGGEKV